MRADKVLFHEKKMGRRDSHGAIAKGLVSVNGELVTSPSFAVRPFDRVELAGEVVCARVAEYLVLNKPAGYVCATVDKESPTVMELLPQTVEPLHLVGRLDKHTTGLVLLTNDGQWSRKISDPTSKLPKVYTVETKLPISTETVVNFQKGMYFAKEGVTSHSATVELLGERHMRLTIYEGLHHQIKRMFLRFGNRVEKLHREQVAGIDLNVEEGQARHLTVEERKQTGAYLNR